MRSSPYRTFVRVVLGVLFPLAVGASGCCGCPVGLCSRAITGILTSGPPAPPVSLPPGFGAGGAGGEGGAFAETEPPLVSEPGTSGDGVAPTKSTGKGARLDRNPHDPIRGSITEQGGVRRFIPHTALNAVSVGDGSSFVVAASTGLWQHETKSLAKQARLFSMPIADVASSLDGTRIAFSQTGGRVRVIEFPSLKTLASANVDEPCRMRFSLDGKRLALASQRDTITLLDIATGKTYVFDTDEDVNDVAVMPDKPDEVAYASDDDEVGVADVVARRKVFGSAPLVEGWRRTSGRFFTMRDQLAVAFDPLTKTLLGGGDDNMVWRVDDIRGAPSLRSPIELGGNVVEIACCAGKAASERAAYVAADDLRVRAVALDGRFGPEFGPLMSSVGSFSIRISLLPMGHVLVVPQGSLFLWVPLSDATYRSNEYAAEPVHRSAMDADTVIVACAIRGCAVHQAVHGPAVSEMRTTLLGDLQADSFFSTLDFADGTRAFAGSKGSKLRLVYLPKLGALETPLDIPADVLGSRLAKKDGTTHGFLDTAGDVYEITSTPRGAKKIGSAPGPGDATDFAWDVSRRRWRVQRGAVETYVP